MKINKLLAVFVLCFSFVGPAMAGLPVSGVESRTGVAPAVTSYDTDTSVSLPHSGVSHFISKVTYTIDAADPSVVTHLCRMDATPTCLDVTGVLSLTTTFWNTKSTSATYAVIRNVPSATGLALPVPSANVTVKLYNN